MLVLVGLVRTAIECDQVAKGDHRRADRHQRKAVDACKLTPLFGILVVVLDLEPLATLLAVEIN